MKRHPRQVISASDVKIRLHTLVLGLMMNGEQPVCADPFCYLPFVGSRLAPAGTRDRELACERNAVCDGAKMRQGCHAWLLVQHANHETHARAPGSWTNHLRLSSARA